MQKKIVGKRFLIVVLVLTGTVILLLRMLPPDRELLNIATPILSLNAWDKTLKSQNGIVFPCPYYFYWLNDHEVLLGKYTDGTHWQIYRKTVTPAYNKAPAAPLAGALINPGEYPASISPDQRWITYFNARGAGGMFHSSYFQLKANTPRPSVSLQDLDFLWTKDSNEILQFYGWPKIIRYTNPDTNQTKTVNLKLPDPDSKLMYMQPIATSANNHLILQFGGSYFDRSVNTVSFRSKNPSRPSICSFIDLDLKNLNAATRTWDARIPPDAQQGVTELSPQNDRILWNVKCTETSKIDMFLHRFFPQWKTHSYETIHWRISRLDGSGLREIAHFQPNSGAHRKDMDEPYPSWVPGGKKLSFIYRETLYVLPVD